MKKLLAVLLLIIISLPVWGQGKELGVGILAGNPTSLSVKYLYEENRAINFGLGFEPFSSTGIVLHADYIYEDPGLFPQVEYFNFYYGFGVRFSDEDNGLGAGARGVFGTYVQHASEPIEFFAEIAPVFRLFPDTRLFADWGVGVHYFFDISGFARK